MRCPLSAGMESVRPKGGQNLQGPGQGSSRPGAVFGAGAGAGTVGAGVAGAGTAGAGTVFGGSITGVSIRLETIGLLTDSIEGPVIVLNGSTTEISCGWRMLTP